MRILINCPYYHPEKIGIGKYTGEMAEWLVSRGHEVRVVTAPPFYPEWLVSAEYSTWRYRRENIEGVDVWRCPLWVPKKPSGLKRILHLASFSLSCLPVMLMQIFWRPDVVLVIEPPLMCAPIAWLTAKLSGAKSWLHIQDFEVDAAFDMGILRSPWMRRFALWCEFVLMSRFDRISTISSKMLEKIISKSISPSKTFLFLNWVDVNVIYPIQHQSIYRAELGISIDKVVALYSGNMGEKQGLDVVVEAARQLVSEERIIFVLCGDGAAKDRLQKSAVGLSNICWLPLQPTERLNDLLNLADVHLLPQRADVADILMPSKLLGMLASGRPVLATANIETQVGQLVANCGKLTSPGNAKDFSEMLKNLADDPIKRGVLGKEGREIAECNFSFEVVLSDFECELDRLIK
ncbi:MAG: glycosyltransferase WbuB [Gallionella sp.]|jgi:colanic acid biosynthesis glycosyl transferase WcaI